MKLDLPRDLAKRITDFWGECTPATVLAALDYAARRKMALAKDRTRYEKGKLATRLYRPRVENVEKVPKPLAQAVETIERAAEKLAANGNGKRK